MVPTPGLTVSSSGIFSLVAFNLEALAVYGLLAFVIGMIAWSKYNEPPIADPYAGTQPRRDLSSTETQAELGPVVAAPVAAQAAPIRK